MKPCKSCNMVFREFNYKIQTYIVRVRPLNQLLFYNNKKINHAMINIPA